MKRLLITAALSALATPALADLDAARALVAQYTALPSFEAPGEAFDAAACMADKKMFVIPLTNANPFKAAISQGYVDAAAIVGFELRDAVIAATLTRLAEITVVFTLGSIYTSGFSRSFLSSYDD